MKKIIGKTGEYKKVLIKIKLDSDDDLPLGKILKLHNLTMALRSIFQEGNKYYPKFLFYMNVCMSYKKAMI